jgi:hypothetical protein
MSLATPLDGTLLLLGSVTGEPLALSALHEVTVPPEIVAESCHGVRSRLQDTTGRTNESQSALRPAVGETTRSQRASDHRTVISTELAAFRRCPFCRADHSSPEPSVIKCVAHRLPIARSSEHFRVCARSRVRRPAPVARRASSPSFDAAPLTCASPRSLGQGVPGRQRVRKRSPVCRVAGCHVACTSRTLPC